MPSETLTRLQVWSANRPVVTAALVVLGIAVLLYGFLIRQQVIVVLWFLLLLFTVHLALRFVRAVERIAAATERYVERDSRSEEGP